jgi:hypothetical protein
MSSYEKLTPKEALKQEKRVRLFFKKWVNKLQLDIWDIKLSIENGYETKENLGYHPQAVGDTWESVMSTTSDPWYMQATITCFLPIVALLDDEKLEETVVHEFMHVYLAPMSSKKFGKEEELVATLLARTFMRMTQ